MIYDCFIFFNELDLLELRLHELNSIVDRFVLVEATRTFTNIKKQLTYMENKERFNAFSHKIIHVVVDDFPDYNGNAWEYEKFQRNAIERGIRGCRPNDIIIISDVDEIPSRQAIAQYTELRGVYSLKQYFFYYFFNYLNQKYPYWYASYILRYKDFKDAETARMESHLYRKYPVIEDGGWHFSYLGGADKIIEKIESFSHQELNKPEFKNRETIARLISSGKDLFGRKGYTYRVVAIDRTFPEQIIANTKKYRNYIAPLSTLDRFINVVKNTISMFVRALRIKRS